MTEKTELLKRWGVTTAETYPELWSEDDEKLYQSILDDAHQPPFAVGEYYSFTTYRKDYDADTNFIFKVLEIKNCGIRVCEYDCHGKNYEEYVYDSDSEFLKGSKPATAEQIATFRRAEHFASEGREWSEFRKGDIVQNTNTMQLGLVESVDEDGDAWVNYNIYKPLIYPSCCKCTGALFLNLIQTAEELQEVDDGKDRKN